MSDVLFLAFSSFILVPPMSCLFYRSWITRSLGTPNLPQQLIASSWACTGSPPASSLNMLRMATRGQMGRRAGRARAPELGRVLETWLLGFLIKTEM